jgi:hypothetical protein
MPNDPSPRHAPAPRSRADRWLPRAPIVYVVAAVSLSALALVQLPPERPSTQRRAVEPGEQRALEESPGPPDPAEAEAEAESGTEPPPPPAPASPEPAGEPALLVEPEPIAAPQASDSPDLFRSVAERREAEEEQRQEAASDAPHNEDPSPALIETPAEQAAMNAVAEQRALARSQWAVEDE